MGSVGAADACHPTVIGYLDFECQAGSDRGRHEIFPGQEIVVGRAAILCQLYFDDPTISNKHLKIYSIVYDQSQKTEIRPLIYAEDLSSNGSYWNGALIGKGNGAILLSDGDELRISPRIKLVFHTAIAHESDELDKLQKTELQYFSKLYTITNRKLGAGAYGQVYMAIDHWTKRQLACKVVDLRKIRRDESRKLEKFNVTRNNRFDRNHTPEAVVMFSKNAIKRKVEECTAKVFREAEILKDLSHVNIIRLEKFYYSDNTLYIFEELITGGDLFSYIEYKGGHLHEAEAGVIVRQVLEALMYLHTREIVHRDVKPDNILIASLANVARVVLTDFGSAIKSLPSDVNGVRRMATIAGTLEYVAPEVRGLNPIVNLKGYTKAVDMWSTGCVTAALLTGTTPFIGLRKSGDNRNSSDIIADAAAAGNLERLDDGEEWQYIGSYPKDFVRNLLLLDEGLRMTAAQALNHPWFTNVAHKNDFDAVHKMAVSGWKPRPPLPDTIEKISINTLTNLSDIEHVHRKQCSPKSKKLRSKGLKPIESHYQPFHRNMSLIITPLRPRPPMPTIVEVAEDGHQFTWQTTDSVASNDWNVQLQATEDDLPMVECLRIDESKTPRGINFDTVQTSPSASQAMVSLISESAKGCIAFSNRAVSGLVASQQPEIVVPETPEKDRGIIYSIQDRNVQINHAGSMIDFSTDKLPETPPSRSLKRRLPRALRNQTSPKRRKRKDIFHIGEDEEDLQALSSHTTDSESGIIPFTPINRRQSVRLDRNRNSLTRLCASLGPSITGHDGPLFSKIDSGNLSPSRSRKSKYVSFQSPHEDLSMIELSKDGLCNSGLDTESTSLSVARSVGRQSSPFDYEEDAIYWEASTEDRLFRSARSYGQSVEKIRAEKLLRQEKKGSLKT